jgi:uncharacterized protein YjdB
MCRRFSMSFLSRCWLVGLWLTALPSCDAGKSDPAASAGTSQLVAVVVTPPATYLAIGATVQLAARGYCADNSQRELTAELQWTAAEPEVASVGANGVVLGVAAGATTVSATEPTTGLSTAVAIVVNPAPATPRMLALVTSPTAATLAIGSGVQLAARAFFDDNSSWDVTAEVQWTCAEPTVASVDATGMVVALAAGATTITATESTSGLASTVALTVNAVGVSGESPIPLQSLTLTPSAPVLGLHESLQLAVFGRYASGAVFELTSLATFTSSAPAIATVSDDGRLVAVAEGTSTLTATVTLAEPPLELSASVLVTVLGESVTPVLVRITPRDAHLVRTQTLQLAATALYADASARDLTRRVLWSSDNEEVARVDAAGLVSTLDAGVALITAADAASGKTDQVTITVDEIGSTVDLESLSLEASGRPLLLPDDTLALTLWGDYAGGARFDLTTFATWLSSAPAVATVEGGVVTAISPGLSVVTATLGAGEGAPEASLTITVQDPSLGALTGVVLYPTAISVTSSSTLQLLVMGLFGSGKADLTDASLYTSSDPTVASVDASGLVTTHKNGSVTLTATAASDATKSQQRTLTVSSGASAASGTPVAWFATSVGGQSTTTLVDGIGGMSLQGGYSELVPAIEQTFVEAIGPMNFSGLPVTVDALLGVEGTGPALYDIASNAAMDVGVGIATIEAGPGVGSSRGFVSMRRDEALGGRMEGLFDITACMQTSCNVGMVGAFSVTKKSEVRFAAEGTAAAPVLLPLEQSTAALVDTTHSYYRFPVEPGVAYELIAAAATDDLVLHLFSDAALDAEVCTRATEGSARAVCVAKAVAGQASFFARVDYAGTGRGAAFSLMPMASPYQAQGSIEAPVALGGELGPLSVDDGASYYVAAVPSGSRVAVRLHDVELAGLTLEVFDDSAFTHTFCSADTTSDPSYRACGSTTGAAVTNLYLRVAGAGSLFGAGFGLEVFTITPEGSAASPLALDGSGGWRQVAKDTRSYYVLPALAGAHYRIELNSDIDDITLLASTSGFTSFDCTASSGLPRSCELVATGAELYVALDGSASLYGSASCYLDWTRLFVGEGSIDAPVALSLGSRRPCEVSSDACSYYTVTIDPSKPHTLALIGDTVPSVVVQPEDPVCWLEDGQRSCVVDPGPSSLLLMACGLYGMAFDLAVGEGLFESELGNGFAVGEARAGVVGLTASEYVASGVSPGPYTVLVTEMSDDVDLEVQNKSYATLCTAQHTGRGAESCTFSAANPWDTLHILVRGNHSAVGASFVVALAAGEHVEHGASGSPESLAVGATLRGAALANGTYASSTVTPGASYYVGVKTYAGNPALAVLAGGSTLCTSNHGAGLDEGCLIQPASSPVEVQVLASPDESEGALFDLRLEAAPSGSLHNPQSAVVGTPIDLTMPSAGDLYLTVSVAALSEYAATLTNLSADLGVCLGESPAFDPDSMSCNTTPGTQDKSQTFTATGTTLQLRIVADLPGVGGATLRLLVTEL